MSTSRLWLTCLSAVGFFAVVAGSGAAVAQDANTSQDGAQVLAKDGAATAADAAKAPPPPGWTVQCANPTGAADGGLKCQAEQSIYVMPQRELLVSVAVHVEQESKQPTMIVRVPLGVLLTGGVQLTVDEGTAAPAPMRVCSMQGCYANVPLAPELLDAMGKGKNLAVAFQTIEGRTVSVPLPLAGFLPAYKKVEL